MAERCIQMWLADHPLEQQLQHCVCMPLCSPLSKAMAERCMKVVKRTGGGGVAFAPLAADDSAANADHNGTVLGLLSA
eukprot:scaffold102003_cov26-Tisochrysis_lutea.AAC.2